MTTYEKILFRSEISQFIKQRFVLVILLVMMVFSFFFLSISASLSEYIQREKSNHENLVIPLEPYEGFHKISCESCPLEQDRFPFPSYLNKMRKELKKYVRDISEVWIIEEISYKEGLNRGKMILFHPRDTMGLRLVGAMKLNVYRDSLSNGRGVIIKKSTLSQFRNNNNVLSREIDIKDKDFIFFKLPIYDSIDKLPSIKEISSADIVGSHLHLMDIWNKEKEFAKYHRYVEPKYLVIELLDDSLSSKTIKRIGEEIALVKVVYGESDIIKIKGKLERREEIKPEFRADLPNSYIRLSFDSLPQSIETNDSLLFDLHQTTFGIFNKILEKLGVLSMINFNEPMSNNYVSALNMIKQGETKDPDLHASHLEIKPLFLLHLEEIKDWDSLYIHINTIANEQEFGTLDELIFDKIRAYQEGLQRQKVASGIVILFCILGTIVLIASAVRNIIIKNKQNFGALMSFGVSDVQLYLLYAKITLTVVSITGLIAYFISSVIGYFLGGDFLKNYLKLEEIPFSILNWWIILIFLLFLVITTMASLFTSWQILHQTPGDLVYGRTGGEN